MILPHWVEQFIASLPADFTGKLDIECYMGGVTTIADTIRHKPPRLWSGGPTPKPPDRD